MTKGYDICLPKNIDNWKKAPMLYLLQIKSSIHTILWIHSRIWLFLVLFVPNFHRVIGVKPGFM